MLWRMAVPLVALLLASSANGLEAKQEVSHCQANTYYWGLYESKVYCVWCPRGKFSPGCLNCPADPHATSCAAPTPAPGGGASGGDSFVKKSAAVAVASGTCLKGKYRNDDDDSCVDCPHGKWQMDADKSECYECPTGMFQPNAGMFGCYACPKGEFQDGNGASKCQECPCKSGMFTAESKQGMKSSAECFCQQCEAGKFSHTLTGVATSCKTCYQNKYSTMGSMRCKLCPEGKFQDAEGQQLCMVKPKGHKPTLTLKGESPVLMKKFKRDDYDDAGASCTDDDGKDLSSNVKIDDSQVDWDNVGDYKIFYTCKDPGTGLSATKARKLNVAEDANHPTINIEGANPVTVGDKVGEKYQDLGARCADQEGNAITDVNSDFSQVDFDTPGTYSITYSCVDKASGSKAEAKREVIVGGKLVPTPMPTTHTKNQKNKACDDEVKQYCGDFDFQNEDNAQKCLQCVKTHIGRIDSGLTSICGLSDLAYMCDTSMAGKTKEETAECETQVKSKCSDVVERGPKCEACIKSHISDIDGGLAGTNMCSRFQLDNYCYFYGEGKSLDPGMEKFDKEHGIVKKAPADSSSAVRDGVKGTVTESDGSAKVPVAMDPADKAADVKSATAWLSKAPGSGVGEGNAPKLPDDNGDDHSAPPVQEIMAASPP